MEILKYLSRVPVETLFLHLEKGIPLDEFLQDFSTVTLFWRWIVFKKI